MSSRNNGGAGLPVKELGELAAKFSVSVVRSALIRNWATSSGVPLKTLLRGRSVPQFLEPADMVGVDAAEKDIAQLLPSMNLKCLEGTLERLMDPNTRRAQGTVYTPDFIINYLVRHCLAIAVKRSRKAFSICDPACGSGGFLIGAADILAAHYNISPSRAFTEHLVGLDVDDTAVEQAKCLIELYLASRGVSLPGPSLHIMTTDTLLLPPEQILSSSGFPLGFDAVVTNPPYVKLQNLNVQYREMLVAAYPNLTMGSFSLALLFLVAGHRLLSTQGCLGMITQNNLFTSLAGKAVRKYLQDQKCIKRIVDFGHHKVFPQASAYTCLVFLTKQPNEAFEYRVLGQRANASTLGNTHNWHTINISLLDERKWRLGSPHNLENLKRIESVGTPIGRLAQIRVGFATLKDSAFFVEMDGNHCVAHSPSGKCYEIETEVTRPAVKVAELTCEEDLLRNRRRIIFPYQKVPSGKYALLHEQVLKETYPRTYEYLVQCKPILETRDKGRGSYQAWYAWARTQGMDAPGPKLLTKTFSLRPQFFLDKSNQLFCNGYAVFPPRISLFGPILPIQALARVLNSTVMDYYAKLTSFQIEGNYQCYQKNFIERFGIPDFTYEQIQLLLYGDDTDVDELLLRSYGISESEVTAIVG